MSASNLLTPDQAAKVRGGHVEYNEVWSEPLKRPVTCRCCGAKISKGQIALRFWWDFTGHGAHFITKCAMHAEPCLPEPPGQEGRK